MTGGGWASDDPPPLAGEAAAILRAVLIDFTGWSPVPVVTTWDVRRGTPHLPADEVVPIDPSSYHEELARVARRCGAAVVIAPETGGELERVTALLEDDGVVVVGSPAAAVAAAADKALCMRALTDAGVPCPASTVTSSGAAVMDAHRMGYPVVLKPRLGAGCERVALVSTEADLCAVLATSGLQREASFLLQEYVDGDAVSVSLLVADGRATLLGVNASDVLPGAPFEYRGGVAGIEHPRRAALLAVARAAVGALSGLRGYVGVDLVVAGDECVVIEVNPRITTSYVGLRRVLPVNLAGLLWCASVEGTVPGELPLLGSAAFTKDDADE